MRPMMTVFLHVMTASIIALLTSPHVMVSASVAATKLAIVESFSVGISCPDLLIMSHYCVITSSGKIESTFPIQDAVLTLG
jgi:hypothetical protein